MQGHSFWLAVLLNTGLDDCALGPLVQCFYWLANQSHVFRGLDPHKRRFRKKLLKEIESWFRRRNVTYCGPPRPRCTCVNNWCIRSKISGYHLDLWTGWIRCNCNAHRKQVDVKQLYNQVPPTVWVSWSSSCNSRQWEPAPDRGLAALSDPRLSSKAEWERSAAIVRGTRGQYVAVCPVSNSPLTDNKYQNFRNPFEDKVCEVYFSKEECSFVIIVDYVSTCICIRIVVSRLYNRKTKSPCHPLRHHCRFTQNPQLDRP